MVITVATEVGMKAGGAHRRVVEVGEIGLTAKAMVGKESGLQLAQGRAGRQLHHRKWCLDLQPPRLPRAVQPLGSAT